MDGKEKVLVTGIGGYIGSILARKLLSSGYHVVGVDSLIYNNKSVVDGLSSPNLAFKKFDISNSNELKALFERERFDTVVHLAALVGDLVCYLSPLVATRTNFNSTELLARLAADNGSHLIFASSASVYGGSAGSVVNEESEIKPLSLYAWTKVLSEKSIQEIEKESSTGSSYNILRFATAMGLSERMRFDLVVNAFTLNAIMKKKIMVFGGYQVRPFVNAEDIADSIMFVMKRRNELKGEVYNIGSRDQNIKITELAQLVKTLVPETEVQTLNEMSDERSYDVDFGKFARLGMKMKYTVESSIMQMREAISAGKFHDPYDKRYYNYPPMA